MAIETPYEDEKGALINEKIIFENFNKVVEANEELKTQPKFIVGHSLGALYALRFCQKYP